MIGSTNALPDAILHLPEVPNTKRTSVIESLDRYYTWKTGTGRRSIGTLTPSEYDLRIGYIDGAVWIPQDPTNTLVDVYEVWNGHCYFITLGNTVGSRFRVAFFTEDITTATERVTGKSIFQTNNPPAFSNAIYKPTSDGWIAASKDNVGVTGLKTYMYDCTLLFQSYGDWV